MGGFLDKPDRTKETNVGNSDSAGMSWGAVGMQGWRSTMEDTHICEEVENVKTKETCMLFGVFDGHGGKEVA